MGNRMRKQRLGLLAAALFLIVSLNSLSAAQTSSGTEPDYFSFSGGTGRLSISCEKVIPGERPMACITFTSGKIIYVKVGEEQYGPTEQTKELSRYLIPVRLNENTVIRACTTAMSSPKEIEYRLFVGLAEEDGGEELSPPLREGLERREDAPEIFGFSYLGSEVNEAASLFRLHAYSQGLWLLELEDGAGEICSCLMVPEGTILPAGIEKERTVITTPVQRACVTSEGALAALSEAGLSGRVASVSASLKELLDGEMKSRLDAGSLSLCAEAGDKALYRDLMLAENDLLIAPLSPKGEESLSGMREGLSLLGLPLLPDGSLLEETEEGKKEWAKVFSLCFMEEDDAQ